MKANFGVKPITLLKGQRVATTDPHPSAITESSITHTKIFDIEESDRQTYMKRILSTGDKALINKCLADSRNSHMYKEEKTVTADDTDFSGVDKMFHQRMCDMLGKHENMRSGQLGHIHVTEHVVGLKIGWKPFKRATFRSGPTARKRKAFKLKK